MSKQNQMLIFISKQKTNGIEIAHCELGMHFFCHFFLKIQQKRVIFPIPIPFSIAVLCAWLEMQLYLI